MGDGFCGMQLLPGFKMGLWIGIGDCVGNCVVIAPGAITPHPPTTGLADPPHHPQPVRNADGAGGRELEVHWGQALFKGQWTVGHHVRLPLRLCPLSVLAPLRASAGSLLVGLPLRLSLLPPLRLRLRWRLIVWWCCIPTRAPPVPLLQLRLHLRRRRALLPPTPPLLQHVQRQPCRQ